MLTRKQLLQVMYKRPGIAITEGERKDLQWLLHLHDEAKARGVHHEPKEPETVGKK